jgi:hypothetical protein
MKDTPTIDLKFKNLANGRNIYCYMQLGAELIAEKNLKFGEVFEVLNQGTGHKTSAILINGNEKINGNGHKLRKDEVLLSWNACRNLGASLIDWFSIRRIYPQNATHIRLMDINNNVRKLRNIQRLSELLNKRIITRGDLITLKSKEKDINFMVKTFNPISEAVVITTNTKFSLGF